MVSEPLTVTADAVPHSHRPVGHNRKKSLPLISTTGHIHVFFISPSQAKYIVAFVYEAFVNFLMKISLRWQ